MNSKKSNLIYFKRILLFILLLLLPIIVILSFILIGNVILGHYNLTLNDLITLSLEGYISTYLTILGIEISAILAIVIYRWQSNDEKRSELEETRSAKRILKVLLINATKRAFEVYSDSDEDDKLEFNFTRITDNHVGLIAAIGDLVTEEEFLYLNLLMETLKDLADKERNDDLYEARQSLAKYMKLITLPFYPLYHFQMTQLDNMYDVMSEKSVKIFNLLTGDDFNDNFDYGVRYNQNREILFEYSKDGCFKVYDSSGDILCNSLVINNEIIDGQAKVFSNGTDLEFEGNFKDKQRNGKGTEYFTCWITGEIKRTGMWENDILINGTVYNVILNNKNEPYILDDEKYNQLYDGFFSLHTLVDHGPECNIATINVNKDKIKIDEKSIVPLSTIASKEGYCL